VRALVLEDEDALRERVVARLKQLGWAVESAADGTDGLWMGEEFPLDVAVVDLGLPGLPGLEVIRRWRAGGRRFPVLILTARDRWQDKVEGLEAGADDYLVKPFNMEELLARLRALVRRAAGWADSVLAVGPYELDTASQQLRLEGEDIVLTAFEYKLAEYLMLHAGRVVSKTALSEHVYAEDVERESNVIEVLLGRLRRKLDPERRHDPIETLRGRGYRFRYSPGADRA
jgi:two-component system response regulator PhoP